MSEQRATLPPDSPQYTPGLPLPQYAGMLPTRPVTAQPTAAQPTAAQPAATGQPQSLLPQPAQAGAAPVDQSPFAPTRAMVAAGESGGVDPYHETYGGGHFGWQGIPNTGSGKYGFTKTTWDRAASGWMAQNPGQPPPDFNKPEDQDKVFDYWAPKRYRENTGRDLLQDQAAGRWDLIRKGLANEWVGLQKLPGMAGASPDYQDLVARGDKIVRDESAEIRRLTAEADNADPDSQLRHQRLQQAMDHSERLSQQFEDMARHPPTETPLDMMQNFGSLATVIALAGGLLAKRPLTAALNAAGSAMRAQQEGNHEQAQRAYKLWQDQTDLISKALNFQNQEINQIMEDRRISEAERNTKIEEHLRLNGMQLALDQWNLGNRLDVYNMLQSLPKAQADLDRVKAETGKANAQREYYERGGAAGKAPRFGTIDDLMQQWHEQFVEDNNREPNLEETAKQRAKLLQEEKPAGQTAQNVAQRLMIGANDVAKTVEAIAALPGGTTLGIFGGAQAALGSDMSDNVRKGLANAAVPEASQLLRTFSTGAARALGTLQSAGAAQGVYALSEQLKADFPEANDTGLNIAAKMADIRQISEAALEILQVDPRLSDDQRAKLTDVLGKIQTAVPYTTKDVALLVDRSNPERFVQFAEKLGLGGPPSRAVEALKAHPEKRDEFDEKFGAGSAAKVLGQ